MDPDDLVRRHFTESTETRRAPLAAISLSHDPSSLTCTANDYDFAQVFARQVRGFGRPGDVLLALATSGGELADPADLCLRAPSDDTPRIRSATCLPDTPCARSSSVLSTPRPDAWS